MPVVGVARGWRGRGRRRAGQGAGRGASTRPSESRAPQSTVAPHSPLPAHRCTNQSDHHLWKGARTALIKQIRSRHPNNCREGSAAATGAPSISGTCPTLIRTRSKPAKKVRNNWNRCTCGNQATCVKVRRQRAGALECGHDHAIQGKQQPAGAPHREDTG